MRHSAGKLGRFTCGLALVACWFASSSAGATTKPHGGFFTSSDHVRLHYIEAGEGAAVVFVPGWSMPGWIWEKQIAYFSEHYHVVALDPRDQGESEKVGFGNNTARRARDIQELIAHLKLKSVVLVGWSLGVPEVLSYAEQFGGNDIAAYVLVDGFVWQKQDPQFVISMLGIYDQLETNREDFTEKFVRSMYRRPQPDEYIKRIVAASLAMPADSAVAASVSSISRADWSPAIRKLDRPVLIACQSVLKPMAADPVVALLPDAQVELFSEAGHALFVDEPDHFNSALNGFVAKLSAQGKVAATKH
jgi:non-heme chloroperoxidase